MQAGKQINDKMIENEKRVKRERGDEKKVGVSTILRYMIPGRS